MRLFSTPVSRYHQNVCTAGYSYVWWQWEDWENSWTPLMCSAAALYFVAYYFRPYHSMDEWARARAIERMNALEASASDEE